MSEEFKYCFRILEGLHSEGGKLYASRKAQKNATLEHHDGDIIHTNNDLTKHNFQHSKKFEVYSENVETEMVVDDDGDPKFDQMTIADLKAFAKENEIDLDGASKKDEILEIILEVWGDD